MELLQLYGLEAIGDEHQEYKVLLKKEKALDEFMSLEKYILKVCGLSIISQMCGEIMEECENYNWMIGVINKDKRELLFEEGELLLTYIYYKTNWKVSNSILLSKYIKEHHKIYKVHLPTITNILSIFSKQTPITSKLLVKYQINY